MTYREALDMCATMRKLAAEEQQKPQQQIFFSRFIFVSTFSGLPAAPAYFLLS